MTGGRVWPAFVLPQGKFEKTRAADIALTADELSALEKAFPRGITAGERYSEQGMGAMNK